MAASGFGAHLQLVLEEEHEFLRPGKFAALINAHCNARVAHSPQDVEEVAGDIDGRALVPTREEVEHPRGSINGGET